MDDGKHHEALILTKLSEQSDLGRTEFTDTSRQLVEEGSSKTYESQDNAIESKQLLWSRPIPRFVLLSVLLL